MSRPNPPHSRFLRVLKHVAAAPLVVVAVVVVLVDDAFRAVVVPAVRRLARLRLVQRAEAWVAGLSVPATLALFLVPLAVIEPCKVYALYLFGEGRWIAGSLMFVVAKVVGLGLAERLFAVSRDKLLSVRWFAVVYWHLVRLRDRVRDYIVRTRVWLAARAFAARVRALAGRLVTAARRTAARLLPAGGAWRRRFVLARRLTRGPRRP